MAEPLVKVFGRFTEAQKAREQLLAAGFGPEQVELTSNEDEAGAVQGNFITGDTDSKRDDSGGSFDPTAGPDDHVYERDFGNVVQRGNYILMVAPQDQEQASRASQILDQADSGKGERLNGRPH